MARLAASHRRRRADRGGLPAARLGKAACSQPDGDPPGLPAARLDPGRRPPPHGHRRLPAADAGKISFSPLSFRDAPLGAGPESILPVVVMDSGLKASPCPGMTNFRRTQRL